MKTLEQIFEEKAQKELFYQQVKDNTPYTKTLAKIKKKQEQLKKIELELEALEKKADKQEQKHYKALDKASCWWGKTVLTPIAEEIINKHSDIFKDFEVIGSFGLDHETSIWFYSTKNEKHEVEEIRASVTFYYRKDIEIATGEKSDLYAPGSIGALNGYNNLSEKVVSIEQVEDYVMKSYRKQ